MRRALAAAIVASLAAAPAALGHGEYTPTIQTYLDKVAPRTGGVSFRVLPGQAARLEATNRTGSDLTVLGLDGKPMLRIGPRGVFANINSLDWYRSGNPDGIGRPPDPEQIGSAPKFIRVARRHAWAWYEHRMHPGRVRLPQEAIRAQRPARIEDWSVPARLGSRRIDVSGHVEYRPLLGSITPKLTSPPAPAPGVQVSVLSGRLPGIFVLNSGRRTLTVRGRSGEPFARIGPHGVEVNLRSPTSVEDTFAKGGRPPLAADAAAPPRWRRVSRTNSYAWLEERALYDRESPPDSVYLGGKLEVLSRWSLPVSLGGRPLRIRGETDWVPTSDPVAAAGGHPVGSDGGGGSSGLWIGAAGLLLVLGLVGALVLRLRKRPRATAR